MSIRRVVKSKDISPQTVTSIGIAVYSSLTHVGLLYRVSEQQPVEILHLKWHRLLASEPPPEDCVCWIRPEIAADRADAIAAQCRRIWKCNGRNQITFSFGRPTGYFDFSGNQIKGSAKSGLTCAAFVLAVFDAAKFPLVLESDWPPPTAEDFGRQNELLESLKETRDFTAEDEKTYKAEIGNVRFRPLEVAGAGTADQFPATHQFSQMMAAQIEDIIKFPPALPAPPA